MYSKGGRKAGKHDWLLELERFPIFLRRPSNIQAVVRSDVSVAHHQCLALPGSPTCHRVPHSGQVEISLPLWQKFCERLQFCTKTSKTSSSAVVTTLNTVQKKGKYRYNILEVEEDDGVDD
ncbi:hypothetical protein GGX14DRAFT_402148 [Mycena pura]|uniref:Uncharacterized protein n=1 Tax=Mycena pura TaxID=153505 RepID=A0AAD6Y9Q1_9AGAR|nr:hypothetical protein GGX14DRAFT_402148 [Mycena pura]